MDVSNDQLILYNDNDLDNELKNTFDPVSVGEAILELCVNNITSDVNIEDNTSIYSPPNIMRKDLSSSNLLSRLSPPTYSDPPIIWKESGYLTVSEITTLFNKKPVGKILLTLILTISSEIISKNGGKLPNGWLQLGIPNCKYVDVHPIAIDMIPNIQLIIVSIEYLYAECNIDTSPNEKIIDSNIVCTLLIRMMSGKLQRLLNFDYNEFEMDDMISQYKLNYVISLISEYMSVGSKVILAGLALTKEFVAIRNHIDIFNDKCDDNDKVNISQIIDIDDIYMGCNSNDITSILSQLSPNARTDIRKLIGSNKTIYVRLFLFNVMHLRYLYGEDSFDDYINSVIAVCNYENFNKFNDPIINQIIITLCGRYYLFKYNIV